jgi:molybdopterin converting factor small subunit
MRVHVRLFATLREGRFIKRWIELREGDSVGDVLRLLDISEEEVGILLCGGRHAVPSTPLETESVVSVFPALGGG